MHGENAVNVFKIAQESNNRMFCSECHIRLPHTVQVTAGKTEGIQPGNADFSSNVLPHNGRWVSQSISHRSNKYWNWHKALSVTSQRRNLRMHKHTGWIERTMLREHDCGNTNRRWEDSWQWSSWCSVSPSAILCVSAWFTEVTEGGIQLGQSHTEGIRRETSKFIRTKSQELLQLGWGKKTKKSNVNHFYYKRNDLNLS